MKKIISGVLCFVIVLCMLGCSRKETSAIHQRLVRTDWADDVKIAINDLLCNYGVDSENYKEDTYAVFDFDNTSCIFDIEEQLRIYQLQTMSFTIEPEKLPEILFSQLSDINADLSSYNIIDGSYKDIVEDIEKAYSYLWKKYGPFNSSGLDDKKSFEIQKDKQWLEFAVKMCALYETVEEVESSSVAYAWVLFWFDGMTEDEIYNLAKKSHEKYFKLETKEVTWTSPKEIKSNVGSVSITWTCGISVTENIKELWSCLDDNGIDVWVCSASCTAAVKAAIDVCGLHNFITGVLAMTNKTDIDGKYRNSYDFETGCGYYAKADGSWEKMKTPTKAQTFLKGKVTAISNAIAPEYNNHGPIAGFMDSTGDFNFCTEYKTLKLVCCFNRANRKVTDGGGLVAETAIYQRDVLKYNLLKANEAGDTLYVLQGRDENGLRGFRNSNKTLRYGETQEKLFANDDNQKQLDYIVENKMTTKEIFETFSIKADENISLLGFETGFLDEYALYHSHE